MGISKISLRNWPKSLLASCVPNLNFHNFLIDFECFYFEINANRLKRGCVKNVFWKTQEKWSFAHATISDEYYFVECLTVLRINFLWILCHSIPDQINPLFLAKLWGSERPIILVITHCVHVLLFSLHWIIPIILTPDKCNNLLF